MDPKEDFYRMRREKLKRAGYDNDFPTEGDLVNKWEKVVFTAGELMERDDLQIYVGDPTETFFYEIWRQTGTTNIAEIARNLNTIETYLPPEEAIKNEMNALNHDFARFIIEHQKSGSDYPLFIIENNYMVPYRSGSILDGNHRLIAILNSLRNGDITDDAPVQVWKGYMPTGLLAIHNAYLVLKDRKPLQQRISLLYERSKGRLIKKGKGRPPIL